ncbi:MAG TPA: RDD family protein [Terrimesophilobacter sp.]|uniref:RDD family protein n=1 Tax=Terrimesophilobacter sp. TaxID=2906435 RepID=UPI002F944BD4
MTLPQEPTSVTGDTVDDELMTGEAVALDLRPTSFVLRGAGAAIDWAVYFGLWIVIVIAVTSPVFQLLADAAVLQSIVVMALVLCIVVIPTTVELLSHGRSLGKLAVGARIVRDDGGAIGFRHAFIRAMTGVLEIFGTLGGLAALVGLLGSKSKRLGDLVAGTYSQHERISHVTPPVFGVPLELMEWSRTADVARMPDALARRIAQFLASAGGYTPQSRDRASRQLAQEAARYVSPVPAANAELFLAAVAAVRRDREALALQLERTRLERLRPVLEGLPHAFPDRD